MSTRLDKYPDNLKLDYQYHYYDKNGDEQSADRFIGRLPEAIPLNVKVIYDCFGSEVWKRK